jgi:phenylpropionate dioxygenase-like ring-hydroxylating dioxygenase large terminal subunit
MYQSPTSFAPHLTPADYWQPAVFEREQAQVFHDSWRLVGTTNTLKKSGDYISAELFGVPLLVRNFEGSLVAFRNVCAHRQSRLVSKSKGHAEKLKCPYHGWEFGSDGLTRRIPAAANFPHFDRKRFCLDRFAVECCGQLVFVRLSETGPSLREWFGEVFDKMNVWFDSAHWQLSMQRRLDYPANWKIPVEISLESYHIPEVHPQTFGVDPGEDLSEHYFHERGSAFYTTFLAPRFIDQALRKVETFLLNRFDVPHSGKYEHHQIFPNLMISHTDSLSLAQEVIPISPTTSACLAIQVGRRPIRSNPLYKMWSRGWNFFTAQLTRQILGEDMAMYREIQAGVQGGNRSGLLGRCEERLEAFQRHVRTRLDAPAGEGAGSHPVSACESRCQSMSESPCVTDAVSDVAGASAHV